MIMIVIADQYVFFSITFLTAPVNIDPNRKINLQKENCIYLHLALVSQNGWEVLNSRSTICIFYHFSCLNS